jgi:putative salt-induced outer membrane protein YdiY
MKAIISTVLFLSLSVVVNAQHKLDGNVSIGADFVKGNYVSFDVYANAEFKQDSVMYSWDLVPSFRYSQQSQYGSSQLNLYEREAYNTGTISRKFGKWKIMGFTEEENSFMRNIDFRGTLGLGVGYELLHKKGAKITLSEAVLPEIYLSSISSSNHNFSLRSSTRLKMTYESKLIKFSSITLFQPAMLTSPSVAFKDNINMRSTSSLAFNISSRFAIGISYIMIYQSYSSYVNPAVVPLEHNTSFFVKYSFLKALKKEGDD